MREEGEYSSKNRHRRDNQNDEPEIVVEDHIFTVNEDLMKEPLEDDFEYEIIIDGSDTER